MKCAAGACWILLLACVTASRAESADQPAASTWADVAKWPDFEGGVWERERGPRPDAPPYQPEVAARLAALGPIRPETLGSANCEPTDGPFARMGEFFYSKDSIFIMMDEDYLSVRHIYMDGRTHDDPDPSYFGHSVGHWDGDTLVIDTVAFLPTVSIAPKVPGEGETHSIERYRLVAPDTLQLTLTIENPKLLQRAWTSTVRYRLRRDLHVQEAFCSQNNRDLPGPEGQVHLDLTPPKSAVSH
jgi:hypothetical protein